ncbi:hypothetical protein ABZ725_34050 [Streptomyces sp. NPDC006872]|uniref:hypothetical protein n=1 Tax=Streptomyces sp. NPDC006872 TaxID=3155720 RepID=UPI00341034E3
MSDGIGVVDQMVFRWAGNRGATRGAGITAVAYSCDERTARDLVEQRGSVLRVKGGGGRTSVVRLIHGDRAVLLRRMPDTDGISRDNTVCHALMAPAATLTARLCLALGSGPWKEDGWLDEARGTIPRMDLKAVQELADKRQGPLKDGVLFIQEPLVRLVAELLRTPAGRVSALVGELESAAEAARGERADTDEAPPDPALSALWALCDIFGNWLGNDGWTYATYDTSDAHPHRVVFVPDWRRSHTQDNDLRRIKLTDPGRDRAVDLADMLVTHYRNWLTTRSQDEYRRPLQRVPDAASLPEEDRYDVIDGALTGRLRHPRLHPRPPAPQAVAPAIAPAPPAAPAPFAAPVEPAAPRPEPETRLDSPHRENGGPHDPEPAPRPDPRTDDWPAVPSAALPPIALPSVAGPAAALPSVAPPSADVGPTAAEAAPVPPAPAMPTTAPQLPEVPPRPERPPVLGIADPYRQEALRRPPHERDAILREAADTPFLHAVSQPRIRKRRKPGPPMEQRGRDELVRALCHPHGPHAGDLRNSLRYRLLNEASVTDLVHILAERLNCQAQNLVLGTLAEREYTDEEMGELCRGLLYERLLLRSRPRDADPDVEIHLEARALHVAAWLLHWLVAPRAPRHLPALENFLAHLAASEEFVDRQLLEDILVREWPAGVPDLPNTALRVAVRRLYERHDLWVLGPERPV